jgi:hypothetical protein
MYDSGFASHWGGHHASDRQAFNKTLHVERQRLNAGGYTSDGKYFGSGAPLFHVYGPWPVDFYIRAADRAAAKRLVLTGYPKAKGLGGSKRSYGKPSKKWA